MAKLVGFGATRHRLEPEYVLDAPDFFSVGHALFRLDDKKTAWFLHRHNRECKVLVNGKSVPKSGVKLIHNDRVEILDYQWVYKGHSCSSSVEGRPGVAKLQDHLSIDRMAKEKAASQKLAKEMADKEKLAREKLAREKLAREKAVKEILAKENLLKEKIAKEKAIKEERERIKRAKCLLNKARLIFGGPNRKPVTFELDPLSQGFSIGRKLGQNNCVVQDSQVAKKHANISYNSEKHQWEIFNFAWSNKVRVNGVPLKFMMFVDLKNGDKVRILEYEWTFEISAEAAACGSGENRKSRAGKKEALENKEKLADELKMKKDQIARLSEVIQVQQKQHENIISRCSSELKCLICDEMFVDPVVLGCGHAFCDYCINQWKSTCEDDPTCPTCREKVNTSSKSIYLKNLVEAFYEGADVLMIAEREELIKERNQQSA